MLPVSITASMVTACSPIKSSRDRSACTMDSAKTVPLISVRAPRPAATRWASSMVER